MKVAIDATPLTLTSGGLPRYVWELSSALARSYPQDEFTLLSDQPFDVPDRRPPNLRRGPGARNVAERRWWLLGAWGAVWRCGAELFHGTHFLVPWAPLRPTVATLLDLSPWLDPTWHSEAEFIRRRAPYAAGLGLATMFITPSRAVRAEAIDRFGIHPTRIVAIPLAASSFFKPVETPPPAGPPYFLYVGALEPRKNLRMLLEAWREVRKRREVELVLAGRMRRDFGPPPQEESGLRILGEAPDADLPELYGHAVAVLYPSFYEGFGLPVLEAMQCGAFVIASSDPALRETAGDGAILLDPRNPSAWVEAMAAALDDPEGAKPWRARALAQARRFSWECTAARTREVYAEALRRFGE